MTLLMEKHDHVFLSNTLFSIVEIFVNFVKCNTDDIKEVDGLRHLRGYIDHLIKKFVNSLGLQAIFYSLVYPLGRKVLFYIFECYIYVFLN